MANYALGYVRGIIARGPSPKYVLIGGTVNSIRGPIVPMIIDQKMAGFSTAAHFRYRTGVEKNRGLRDILFLQLANMYIPNKPETHCADQLQACRDFPL